MFNGCLWLFQCFHNRLIKNPFTISNIPFSPQNFLATQTVENIKKIQANLRHMYHRPYEKSSIITLPENLGKLSRVPSMKVSAPHICLCSSRGVRCSIMQGCKLLSDIGQCPTKFGKCPSKSNFDQGFLVSPLVLIRKPWERGCHSTYVVIFRSV